MENVLTRKLECFGQLSGSDRAHLNSLIQEPRHFAARQDIIREGEAPANVRLITEGLACRYGVTADGGRQITALLLPGDFCDLHVFILKAMDHSISTLSTCKVVDIPRKDVIELTERPAIARALWWATLVDEAVLRAWLVNLGRREAEERISHLVCELYLRLQAVGLAADNHFNLSVTQDELADVMGLSSVHCNRAIRGLRHAHLLEWKGKHIEILDLERLKMMSGFNANYLHLTGGKTSNS
jgi:CRP-like cAMP-binding protein